MIGRTLGHYRIEAKLGQGGMGVVYRARDMRLDRPVAIKVLPAEAVVHPERKKRFIQEARAASALNHPNIVHVYDIDEAEGVHFIAMEYVAGETLADKIDRHGLPWTEALDIAVPITDALARAHAAGIVHRDLKPANIMVSESGLVKLLDFGLAKLTEQSESDPNATTRTMDPRTEEGTVVGTAPYMSPEQVQGKKLDGRSDIFSFGAVLYEMLTGQRAFRREDRIATLSAIGREEPKSAREIVPDLPLELERLLARCLRKDPARRWQTMADLKVALEDIREAREVAPVVAPRRLTRARLAWGVAIAACAAILLLLAAIFLHRPRESAGPIRFVLLLPEESSLRLPAPSPDGRQIAYTAPDEAGRSYLWIQALDSLNPRKLSGTADALRPFWSGDGRWIGFTAQGTLKKVSPLGGPVQTIAGIGASPYIAWNQHGDILFAPSLRAPLYCLRESGGDPVPVTSLDDARGENSHRGIQFLPGGRRFLFHARCSARENNAIYLGSLDSAGRKLVMPAQSQGFYVPAGEGRDESLLFFRDGSLFLQPFRAANGELHGEPAPVAEHVMYGPAGANAFFTVSANGNLLLYREGAGPNTELTWYDRPGNALGILGSSVRYGQPRISADGARVAVERADEKTGNRDIWFIEAQRGVATRLTVNPANDWHPVWSPEGSRLVFGSDRQGRPENLLFTKTGLDPGVGEEAVPGNIPGEPSDWSPDGRWVLFHKYRVRQGGYDIWALPMFKEGKPFPFLTTEFQEHSPRFSPDGRWIAYVSNESGRYEVYIRPFDGKPASPAGKVQISTGGGDFPEWSRDGRELYYLASDLSLVSVSARGLNRSEVPPPTRLFQPCAENGLAGNPFSATPWNHPYTVAPDGRFLFNCEAAVTSPVVVAINWAAGLPR